jgi:hypothetical protein
MTIAESTENCSAKEKPSLQAAILLWALELLKQHRASWPLSAADIFSLTTSSKSQGYAMLAQLKQITSLGLRPLGRPATAADHALEMAILKQVRDFLITHPGVVHQHGTRRRYHLPFRQFVLDLMAPQGLGASLTIEQLAEAVGVPEATLKQWRQNGSAAVQPSPLKSEDEAEDSSASASPSTKEAESQNAPSINIQTPELSTIISEWMGWTGDFTSFCQHIKSNCRLNFGVTFIRNLLDAVGLRQCQRRGKAAAPPPWSRGTYQSNFPGAQWLGDGKQLELTINGKVFRYNWEAMMDVASNAIVGFTVSDEEDEAAVIDAFASSLKTAQAPLAVSLDMRPSNHSPAVKEALSPATVLPSTVGRGQAKAAIEGMFGLFSQTAPPLNISGNNHRELGRSILTLLLTLWCLARNGKPRRRLKGLAPADAYQRTSVTPKEVQAAKDWICELRRRAERAQKTRLERADPIKRQLLKQALIELQIDDPQERICHALCTYSTSAMMRGIATFKAKKEKATLPSDADNGRYLGGIIRNLHQREELERTASYLLEQRLRHQELSLAPLQDKAKRLLSTLPPSSQVERFVDLALGAKPLIDFRFWGLAAAKSLGEVSEAQAAALYPALTRKIAATFATTKQRREDLIAWLSEAAVVPVLKSRVTALA